MGKSNAERVIQQYIDGWYDGRKGDKIRLNDSDDITSCGTLIGRLITDEDYVRQFLILTMQDYKYQPTWQTHKKQLAHAANAAGIRVIFIPELDIGFGLTQECDYHRISMETHYANLLKVAAYSQDDIKTAACVVYPGYGELPEKVIAYACNQNVAGEGMLHAEAVVVDYCQLSNIDVRDMKHWYMLLEPCYHCLWHMVQQGAEQIVFAETHKEKWNTSEYIQAVNDICARWTTSMSGRPILYKRIQNNKVTKQMLKWSNGGKK